MSAHVFLVAAEESGDAIGADVIDALRAADPSIRISGIGGARMAERGASSAIDMSGLAVLGLIDGVKAFGRVKRLVEEAKGIVAAAKPDAVVLIDSWGFMWRLARALKEAGVGGKRIKLIGPQVWATRPGRAQVLARWCDHLLCIHEFEQPFYKRWGLPTTVIGNPALGRMARADGSSFRAKQGLGPDAKLIGLLPGSRRSEIRRVGPVLTEAARCLSEAHPGSQVVCIVAESVREELAEQAKGWAFPHVFVVGDDDKACAMAALDVALACSGTVTTELAAQGAPVVVGYKLGWITWAIARGFLMKSRYITLFNVAASAEIAPEFVQTRFTVARVVAAAGRLLIDPETAKSQRAAQDKALKSMTLDRPAAEIAAVEILHLAAPG